MTDPTASVRRRWWRPGRIALVVLLLVAVGGGAGWMLGGLDAPRNRPGASDGDRTPRADPTAGNATTESPECLAYTEEQAVVQYGSPGGLEGIVYLRGVHEERSDWPIEVWICRDAAGKFFYQGYNGTPEQRNLIEGENAVLLVVDLREEDEGRYVAFDRGGERETRYEVQVADCEVEIGDNDFVVTHVQPGGGCG